MRVLRLLRLLERHPEGVVAVEAARRRVVHRSAVYRDFEAMGAAGYRLGHRDGVWWLKGRRR